MDEEYARIETWNFWAHIKSEYGSDGRKARNKFLVHEIDILNKRIDAQKMQIDYLEDKHKILRLCKGDVIKAEAALKFIKGE